MLTIMENDNNNTKQQYPTEEILNSAFEDLFNRDVEKYNRDMEISRGVVDEFGATYSKDGQQLLKVPTPCKTYDVRKGTKVIREQAFSECKHLKSVTIPDTVTTIGRMRF
jgi:hypothetical protein